MNGAHLNMGHHVIPNRCEYAYHAVLTIIRKTLSDTRTVIS